MENGAKAEKDSGHKELVAYLNGILEQYHRKGRVRGVYVNGPHRLDERCAFCGEIKDDEHMCEEV